jgi:2,5-diamino-6-(ribosylamino)-4(3H)-pyrimidinone 5'-phosphate reductase
LKKPYVIINCAMSADGKISTFERRQVRISGKSDLARVDVLRAKSDAIMVGVGTVLADDPSLRVKSEQLRGERISLGKPENPLRVVADSLARTPLDAQVLLSEGFEQGCSKSKGCIIGVSAAAQKERVSELGRRCEVVLCGEKTVNLRELLSILHGKGVKTLMVEGGGRLNWSMIREGLVDEICVYIGALIIGGKDAPTLMDGAGFTSDFPRLELISIERLDEGALLRWQLADSDR